MPDASGDKLVQAVLERHKTWERAYWSRMTVFADGEKRYRGNIHRDQSKLAAGLSDMTDMEFTRVVESVSSAVHAVNFSESPPVTVVASSLDEERELQAAASQGMLERVALDMSIETKGRTLERMWSMHGTAFAEPYWNFRQRWVGRRDAMGREVVQKIPYLDLPDLRPLPVWRVAFDPGATSMDNAEWVLIEEDMTEGQVMALIRAARSMGSATWNPMWKGSDEAGAMPETPGAMVAEQVRKDRGEDWHQINKNRFRVKRYWGRHPLRKDLPVDYLIVIVNDREWAVQMANPYDHGLKPLVAAQFITMDESMYGLGLTDLLARTHDQIIQRTNFMTDLLMLALVHGWTAQGASKTNELLRVTPGKVIYENQWGNGLKPLMPNLTALQPAWMFLSREKEDMRVLSAATTTQQALSTGDTATEVKIIAGESGRRVLDQAQQFSVGIMRPWWFMAHEMCRQFISQPMRVKITGHDDRMVGSEDMVPDPRIMLHLPTDLESRPALLRRMSSALQQFVAAVAVMPEARAYVVPLLKRMGAMLGVDVRGTAAEQEAKISAEQEAARAAQLQALQSIQGAMGGQPA